LTDIDLWNKGMDANIGGDDMSFISLDMYGENSYEKESEKLGADKEIIRHRKILFLEQTTNSDYHAVNT
jgi:hypothetical protein